MQNLPRDGTSKVKEMFVSRFGSEGRIVEVDYSALEVVTLGSISGDLNLLAQLAKGTDMHCYRLAFKEGLPYPDVLKMCKDKSHPDHAEWDAKRTAIKTPSFADQYGASAYGVAFAAGCSVEFAEEFQENERKLFPESKAYPFDIVRPMVEATGLANKVQRERMDTGHINLYRRGYFQAKSGNCYSFRQYDKWDKGTRRTVKDYKDTQIANYWCQGEAAFIVQAACGLVIKEFIKRDFFDGQALVVNTVHDAIYLDCANESIANEAGALVRRIMEYTPKWLAKRIPALKEWRYDVTPFPAAAEQGSNMASKQNID